MQSWNRGDNQLNGGGFRLEPTALPLGRNLIKSSCMDAEQDTEGRTAASVGNNDSKEGGADQRLLSKAELARVLRVSPRTLEGWAREGRIPVLRLGVRCIRYRLDRVLAALDRFEVREVGR